MIDVTIPKFSIDITKMIRLVKKIVTDSRKVITDRTLSGIDVNGNNFDTYSERYKKYKQTIGLTGERVTLRNTGNMLNSISQRDIDGGSELYFSDKSSAIIGYAHNEGSGNVPKREWLGLSDEEYRKLEDKHLKNEDLIK